MVTFFHKLKSFFLIIYSALKVAFLATKKALKVASDWTIDFVLKKFNFIVFIAIITIIALIIRIKLIDFHSPDFFEFLEKWCKAIAQEGGFANFGKMSSSVQVFDYNQQIFVSSTVPNYDYTMPYLYVLTAISYLKPEHYIYGIKAVSIFFDFILALFIALTAKKICKNNSSFIVAYGVALLFPNVILNSAIWGQCDVIFSTFIIISIYCLLCNKPRLAMLAYGVSFCFKIQAVFFLPVILLVMVKKKVNVFYFVYSFISILLLNIPAFFMGIGFNKAIIDPIKTQTEEYNYRLTSGAPNLYHIIEHQAHFGLAEKNEPNVLWKDWFSSALVAFSIGVVGLALIIAYRKKFRFTAKKLVLISYFFAMLLPYILPHMHERYWYLSDVLAILFAVCYRKYFYIAILSCYSSFRACINYLFDTHLSGDFYYIVLALILFVAIILTFRLVYKELNCNEGEEFGCNVKLQTSGAICSQNGENLDINKEFTITNLATGEVVESVEPSVTVVKQSLEEFLGEETIQEKALEETLTKAFGTFEFGEEEGCSCHTDNTENK